MLDDFQNRIEKLRAFDFGQEMQTIVENNSDKLAGYIREQLSQGIDGDGKPVQIFDRLEYRPLTIEIKQREGIGLGAVTDRITNYMSGAFYESLKVQTEGQVFEADSDVSYFGDIRLRSSDSLLEIDEANRKEFAENVTLPGIKEALLTKTGLTIN
jgi:hypothetical protein